jgi:hypothetical protein
MKLPDPKALVSVPCWVLNELVPMSLGALEILRKTRESRHPSAIAAVADISDDDMDQGYAAVELAHNALIQMGGIPDDPK